MTPRSATFQCYSQGKRPGNGGVSSQSKLTGQFLDTGTDTVVISAPIERYAALPRLL